MLASPTLALLLVLQPVAKGCSDPVDAGGAPSMRAEVEAYQADRGLLGRAYFVPLSAERRGRMRAFQGEWLGRLEGIEFEELDVEGRVEWVLMRNLLRRELAQLGLEEAREGEALPLLPAAGELVALLEERRRLVPIDPPRLAERVQGIAASIDEERKALAERPAADFSPVLARRALGLVNRLRGALGRWHAFYDGYDPLYSWWVAKPYEELQRALKEHEKLVRERFLGEPEEEQLLGDPIGRAALLAELEFEFMPYTPEELIAIAERELAWCDAQMLRASEELGFGDDWRAAQAHVAEKYVEPGRQPELIRTFAEEAIEYLESRALLTIPALAKESWRMEMLSPEQQKTAPYFLGGETILVSFPTSGMAHEDKLSSLRGNNEHFVRATVHHELIPGHHLQGFMNERHRPWRRLFRTPFWIEGWALYWELSLWDRGFPRSAEDRIGMLFWRKHRCVRIVFSLRFQLGEWSAERCVDELVERVGHEKKNAQAEVRRSIAGDYGPLYQCAYMLGALQLRRLHEELVGSGAMPERDFHDAVLQRGPIPIELLRAELSGASLERSFAPSWRFAD